MDMLGLSYPGADWLDCKTSPTMLPPLDEPACCCGSQAYVKPGNASELEIPKATTVVHMPLPLLELEQPLENILTSNLMNTRERARVIIPLPNPKGTQPMLHC